MFELLDTPVLFAAVDAVEVLRALPAALPPAPVVSPFYDHPWGFKAREDLTRRGTDLWRYKRHRHRRRAVDRRRPRGAKPATG